MRPLTPLEELRRIQAETCKTFANPKRLLILEAVWDGEVSYVELTKQTGLDKVTLTQHTSIMRQKGILKVRRADGSLLFTVANPKILKAFRLMREVIVERIKSDSELIVQADEKKPKQKKKGDA
jgi:ArsR family transcriptional regulator